MNRFVKSMIVVTSFVIVVAYAKQMSRLPQSSAAAPSFVSFSSRLQSADEASAGRPKINPELYAQNKVAALSQQLISDIFPKEETIERIVFEFKDQFPGSNKQTDVTILYNAIMYNPEIRKFVTLKNAVPVYNFVTEALSKAWDKKDNLVWAQ